MEQKPPKKMWERDVVIHDDFRNCDNHYDWYKSMVDVDEEYYLSDELTKNEVQELIEIHQEKRVMVSLNTPMGTGKTTFLRENLLPVAKQNNLSVLVITGRKTLRDQIRRDYYEVNRSEKFIRRHTVDIECYQKLGHKLKSHTGYEEIKDKYDIIVVDESHQLMLDALFSFDNELVVEFLTELSNSMLFLISATDYQTEAFIDKFVGYKVKITGKIEFSMLDSIVIGNQRQIVGELQQEITPETKVFSINSRLLTKRDGETGVPTELVKFFLDLSKNEEYDVGTQVGDNFIKSHENDTLQEYVELIEQLKKPIVNKQMQCRILVSSEVARDGIEIKNTVDIIVTDFINYDELWQSINRVRNLFNVKLYIVCHNKQALVGKLNSLKNKYRHTIPMFWDWYDKNCNTHLENYIVKNSRTTALARGLYRDCDGQIKLRKAMMCNVVFTIEILEDILSRDYGFYLAHSYYIKDLLIQNCNVNPKKIVILVKQAEDDERQRRADEVERYLSLKMLDSEEHNEYVIRKDDNQAKTDLGMIVGAVDKRGKASKTIGKINQALIYLGLGDKYVLSSEKKWNPETQKTEQTWIIRYIEEFDDEDNRDRNTSYIEELEHEEIDVSLDV